MKACAFEKCKYKIVGKQYEYCIKHMSHQSPISNTPKPDECPVCLCGEEEEKFTLYCCGHHVHKKCIIQGGKAKCPVCRQFIYLDKPTLQELRTLAKQRQLETQYPLLIVFEIRLGQAKPLGVRYGMNPLYKHDARVIENTVYTLRKYIIKYMHDLDGSILATCITNTFTHRLEQVDVIQNLVREYHKDIIVDMMKQIVNDVKENDKIVYFPSSVDTRIEYNNDNEKCCLTFYCKIKKTHYQEGTPEFGYIDE